MIKNIIKTNTLHTLQKALNMAIKLDPMAFEKLKKLEKKILEINILPLNIIFFIHFTNFGLELSSDSQIPADTIIKSSPLGFIRLSLLPPSKARSLFNDQIRISGDLEFGLEVKKWFDSIDIDWEGHLAAFTGDIVAHNIGTVFRQSKNIFKDIYGSFTRSIQEYLQAEYKLTPSPQEIEDFFEDIQNLVLDIDRLEAKIKLLKQGNL